MSQPFEDVLFPQVRRIEYANANVATDATIISGCNESMRSHFDAQADRLFPGFDNAQAGSRIGVLSLFLPCPCDATCPAICLTDIANWQKNRSHIKFDELLAILDQFKGMGGRLVRVIGDGEPRLYPYLIELCQWVERNDMNIIIFTNGIDMSKGLLDQYTRSSVVYFYIKLWSEDQSRQNEMVSPRTSKYRFIDGRLGMAPEVFYKLYEADPGRVGFQSTVMTCNQDEIAVILDGPKKDTPMFIEPFVPAGSGEGQVAQVPGCLPFVTKSCSLPPRSSYLATVNSFGELEPGAFVPGAKNNFSVKDGKFEQVWKSVFTQDNLFFLSRYSGGCFCEAQRNQVQS